jgi:hypothetical protein
MLIFVLRKATRLYPNRVVWRAYTGGKYCVFDQIPNLQNCLTTPNKNQEGVVGLSQINRRHVHFTGQYLRRADI